MNYGSSVKFMVLFVVSLITAIIFSGCVSPVNHPPTIISIPNTSAFVDTPYIYDVEATDPDVGDILNYFLSDNPEGMTINPTSGLINWTPTAAQMGNNSVTVEVYDNGSLVQSDSQSFTITVSYAGSISGTVTSDVAGPVVEGSTVTVDGTTISTITDAAGNYLIDKVPVGTHDVIVTKQGRATSKMQDVVVTKDQTTRVDFIQKEVNVPTWETEAPTISATGIAEGDILSGMVTCSAQVADASDIKCIYVGFNYIPSDLEHNFESDTNEITLGPLDTTTLPDGELQIIIVTYDMNYNRSQLTLNVTISNGNSGTILAIPTSLWPLSITVGKNIGYFSAGREELFKKIGLKEDPNIINLPGGREIDLNAIINIAGPDSTLCVKIYWDDVKNATGYKIYRKFEGENIFRYIGSTEDSPFYDTDPQLGVGRKTYYQVSAYNSFGESEKTTAEWTIPLPKFNLNLVSPQDGATGVSIKPTLRWQPIELAGKYQQYFCYIIGKNDDYYTTWSTEVWNKTSVVYDGEPLQHLKVYEWNVNYAVAYDDDYGTFPPYRAVSFAGVKTGSLNGAFEFTTQSE